MMTQTALPVAGGAVGGALLSAEVAKHLVNVDKRLIAIGTGVAGAVLAGTAAKASALQKIGLGLVAGSAALAAVDFIRLRETQAQAPHKSAAAPNGHASAPSAHAAGHAPSSSFRDADVSNESLNDAVRRAVAEQMGHAHEPRDAAPYYASPPVPTYGEPYAHDDYRNAESYEVSGHAVDYRNAAESYEVPGHLVDHRDASPYEALFHDGGEYRNAESYEVPHAVDHRDAHEHEFIEHVSYEAA